MPLIRSVSWFRVALTAAQGARDVIPPLGQQSLQRGRRTGAGQVGVGGVDALLAHVRVRVGDLGEELAMSDAPSVHRPASAS